MKVLATVQMMVGPKMAEQLVGMTAQDLDLIWAERLVGMTAQQSVVWVQMLAEQTAVVARTGIHMMNRKQTASSPRMALLE